MALKSTICKAELQLSDLDRHYYATHNLTLARHPSETDERMMVRLLAFALYASETLAFGKGLSAEDEPDLIERDPTGAVARWIDVGLPDEREVRRASHKSGEMILRTYGGCIADLWGQQAGRPRQPDGDRCSAREQRHARVAGRPHDAPFLHDPGRGRLAGRRCRQPRTPAAPAAGAARIVVRMITLG